MDNTNISHGEEVHSENEKTGNATEVDVAKRIWAKSWTYVKTVVDIMHEPFLVLDKDLRVMAANEAFYKLFQAMPSETESKSVYELGNGQWNIPSLQKLLEEILPKNKFFKGYEVIHEFPHVGKKIIILNARRVYETASPQECPPIILLAMEDVTEIMAIAERFAAQTSQHESRVAGRIEKLEALTSSLTEEIATLKLPRV